MYRVLIGDSGAPDPGALEDLTEYESDYVPQFPTISAARGFAERRYAQENEAYEYTGSPILWNTVTDGEGRIQTTYVNGDLSPVFVIRFRIVSV